MNKHSRPFARGDRSVDEITGSRRLRRMRKADWSRRLVRESRLTVDDLIWPIFLTDGEKVREPIPAMPGVFRLSVDLAVKEAERAARLGIPALATFPNIDAGRKDVTGSHILDADNLINRATRAIKAAVPEIGVITDAALDPLPATAMTACCATASSSTTRRSSRSRRRRYCRRRRAPTSSRPRT